MPRLGASIEIQNGSKSFRNKSVFENVDLTIAPGEFVSIVGSSGCGKTTLLRLIAGLDQVDGGKVSLSESVEMGFVFQEAHLLPWRTVRENAQLPLELRATSFNERATRIDRALSRASIRTEERLFPAQLSGGMKMRASLARAIVNEPNLLLLDEPFSALDELTRLRLEEELRLLWNEQGMTIVFVTHSFSEAVFLSDRIIMLSTARRGIGDTMKVGLEKKRDSAIRAKPEFSSLVLDCRRRFEVLERPSP